MTRPVHFRVTALPSSPPVFLPSTAIRHQNINRLLMLMLENLHVYALSMHKPVYMFIDIDNCCLTLYFCVARPQEKKVIVAT